MSAKRGAKVYLPTKRCTRPNVPPFVKGGQGGFASRFYEQISRMRGSFQATWSGVKEEACKG
uniref:Uncharacterized protein n=1 Tax=Citrifermentans bremense TaxID=60035 RepID=A0A6S6M9W9_9BACT